MADDIPSAADKIAQQQQAQKQLVLDYKAVFNSEKGQRVLADLKQRFGFDRWEADSEQLTDNQIARRVCMKGPLYHIERLRNTTFREKARPKRALSAKHHENTD
jgi:hypothetical protein